MEKLKAATVFMTISCMLTATSSWFQEENNSATFHFFIQNLGTGPTATAFTIATASITPQSPTMFGLVIVADDKLTEGPEFDSAEVGRVQGLSASCDLKIPTTLEMANFFLTSGKYNGSTIAAHGRHRSSGELPVIGGSGVFRFARGYAIASAYPNEDGPGRTVLEYWIHVTASSE